MALIYKTLFEVKLLHEYFLTDNSGNTIFELADQKDRILFLLQEYSHGRESIGEDLNFQFPEKFKSIYKGYHLKLLPSYSGFKVAIVVEENKLSDNSKLYKPRIPFPPDFNIYIEIIKNNNSIDTYSNVQFKNSIPSIYFFSNDNLPGIKTFPFLNNDVSVFNPSNKYEQGELALHGVNDIREYLNNGSPDPWESVKGNTFVNKNDSLLLPLKFQYSFFSDSEITEANFILKDNSGTIIKQIPVDNTGLDNKVLLDFSDKETEKKLGIYEPFSSAFPVFTLETTGSNGYSKTHSVILSDFLFSNSDWGVINIRPNALNPFFNLFDYDGFIIKRKNASGVWTEAPVFEVPIKSQFPYWRYINNQDKELELTADLGDYLDKENKVLLTKKPRSLSKHYFFIKKEGSPDSKYLPNPVNFDVKKFSNERLCLDINVPESLMFPTIP